MMPFLGTGDYCELTYETLSYTIEGCVKTDILSFSTSFSTTTSDLSGAFEAFLDGVLR